MGIYDRDYARHEGYGRQYSMGAGFRGMPPVVKWLLIINFAIFIIGSLVFPISVENDPQGYIPMSQLERWFAVYPASVGMGFQLWRVITYQFLHGSVLHIVFNLIVLYFFGPVLERQLGSVRFLKFYLIAGAAGGILYTFLVMMRVLHPLPMVGASGAIYGVVAALAVLYPRMKVLLWGIIPMTMVWLVVLVVILSLMNIAAGNNAGGELAHLTGLAVGYVYVKYRPLLDNFRMQRHKGAWEKKMEQQMDFQRDVDRILDKVHREGINSLSTHEKQILQEATRREQQEG